jgi:hypothetical protein
MEKEYVELNGTLTQSNGDIIVEYCVYTQGYWFLKMNSMRLGKTKKQSLDMLYEMAIENKNL